jgi:hypothetical protein
MMRVVIILGSALKFCTSQLGCSVPIACRFGAVRARAARLGGPCRPK